MIESGTPVHKSKIKAPTHKFLGWAPPSVVTGLLAVTALGGESVRAKIWDAIVAIATDPVALPGAIGVAIIWALAWWLTRDKKSGAESYSPPPMPILTADEAEIYRRTRLAQLRAEEQRALDAEEQARSSREFHRGLEAYTRFEHRARPMPVGVAHIGTLGAALFGLDESESFVAIDIKNFGETPARDVTWKAVTGWFSKQPNDPVPYEAEGGVGITEPGHSQHIKLLLAGPLTSGHVRRVVRGGEGFYALARIDYTDVTGARRCRRIAYYLDPQGQRLSDRWMLSVCPTGNDEVSAVQGQPALERGKMEYGD